jgi:hypothetical protein
LREASYQSHCEDAPNRRLILAEVVNSTDTPIGDVNGVRTFDLAGETEASETEASDEDVCLVEGEDRSS